MKRFGVALTLMFVGTVLGQSPSTGRAESKGPCSPANSGNNNSFSINCGGIGKAQGIQIIRLLNDLLQKRSDIDEIRTHIDSGFSQLAMNGSPQHGVLTPATDPDPPLPIQCSAPAGAFKVFLGNTIIWKQNLPILAFSVAGGRDYVRLLPSPDGIAVNANVTAPDGKIMVNITDSAFIVNLNNTLYSRLLDPSTLQVVDEKGDIALYVRFMNSRSVKILGRFFAPSGPTVINEGGVHIPSGGGLFEVGDTCIAGNDVDGIHVDPSRPAPSIP